MSIQTELTRITNAKAAIKTAIEGKGVTVPEATLLDGMASLIEAIEAGGGEKTLFGAYFETGSIIPASNITAPYTIHFQRAFMDIDGNDNHPACIFVLWCSIPPGYTSVVTPNNSWSWVFIGRRKKNTPFFYGQYLTDSGSVSNAADPGAIGILREDGADRFILSCTPSKKLVAGYVYNWIALAPSSEGYGGVV